MPEISKRELRRLRAADKTCRELRYLIANDGIVDGRNSHKLMDYLTSWMRSHVKNSYKRP